MTTLTVAQAAERLATSGRNMRRMIQAGQLRATAVSSRLYLIEGARLGKGQIKTGAGPAAAAETKSWSPIESK